MERLSRDRETNWTRQRKALACVFLRTMPPLSHYPDRTQPFEWDKSEVIQWIKCEASVTLEDAIIAFKFAKDLKAIVFEPETKVWRGNPDWSEKLYCGKPRRRAVAATDRLKVSSP